MATNYFRHFKSTKTATTQICTIYYFGVIYLPCLCWFCRSGKFWVPIL